ncbi:MAG: hypothetical protein EGP06_05605 [SAR202 cluster bacterium]|nr:MAG: hypothetical protein EGP06_05605 [SAR202 cluster bacterium]
MSYKKIGIIGFGSWVKNAYLPILSNIKEVTISHISAKTKESLDLAKNKINNDSCKFSSDYLEVINNKDLDLIILSVPDNIHGKILDQIISKDIDCIFEMPISDNNKEAEAIINKISSKNNIYIPNLEMSYLPVVDYLRDIFSNKEFGDLLTAKLKLSASWWPGFSIYSASSWYIDVLNNIFNLFPKKVISNIESNSNFPTESKGSAILDYGDFLAEWEFDMESNEILSVILDLYFEKKLIKVDLLTSEIKSENNKKISFSEPYQGWAGMKEFIINSVFEKQDKDIHMTNIEVLQKISNGLDLSMKTKDWSEIK